MPLNLGLNTLTLGGGGTGVSAAFTVSIGSGPFTTGATLTATINGLQGGETVTYQWQDDGVNISGATASTYVAAIGTDGVADLSSIRCVATIDTVEYESGARQIRYAVGSNTVAPVVSGSTGLGDVLSSTQGTWTGSDLTFTYQWQRAGVDISGATTSSYMIVQADSGAAIRCVVTATNSGGAASANSNAITADTFSVPSITGVPAISGTEQVGSVLTATAASVSGNPTPTRTWQWERNGSAISGATSSTYTLVSADEGTTLTVVQTETNALGADSAESAATGTIAAAPTGLQLTTADMAAQASDGDVAVTLTGDNGTYNWILTSINPTTSPPSVAQVNAGNGQDGNAAEASGSVAVVSGTPANVSLPTGLDESLYLVVADSDSVVFDATAEAIDTTAPTLSLPVATQTGETTASWSITSNEADGTIYAGVRPTASAALTASQLIAGSGGAGVAFDSDTTPTADASNAGTFSGLTASTAYRVDYVQVDSNGNQGTVVSSAEFTTAAASAGITVEGIQTSSIVTGAGTVDVTIPGTPQENDIVEVLIGKDGTFWTTLSGYTEIHKRESSQSCFISQYKRMGGTPDSVVSIPQESGNVQAVIVRLLRGVNTTTALDVNTQNFQQEAAQQLNTTPPPLTTVTNGALVTVVGCLDDEAATSISSYPAGYTDTAFAEAGGAGGNNSNIAIASKIVATAGLETPGDIVFTPFSDHIGSGSYAWRPA